MPISWKKNKKLKPNVILKKIDGLKIISTDGKISYQGFGYDEAKAVLQNMLAFPDYLDEVSRRFILSRAITKVALQNTLNEKLVINAINNELKIELKKKEKKYHVLSSITMKSPLVAKFIKIENCNIRIFDTPYPKKYTGRNELIKRNEHDLNSAHFGYAKIIITVKAKSVESAAKKALNVIDVQRAIWNLYCNDRMELIGDEWKPINKFRLGEAHTIHEHDGVVISDVFWFEPNFVKTRPICYKGKQYSVLKYNSKRAIINLYKSKYSATIRDALLRFVRALDERDPNVAFIKLWGALEAIASPKVANYDLVIKRCSYLFEERDYHKQVLEHLREYRNSSIHAGDQSARAKKHCFQLQFYFKHLILFHLRNCEKFNSLEEVNNFLDLPANKNSLERQKYLLEEAIDFVS